MRRSASASGAGTCGCATAPTCCCRRAQEAAALARLAELQASQALLDRPLAAIDLRLPDQLVLRPPRQAQPGTRREPTMQRARNGRG